MGNTRPGCELTARSCPFPWVRSRLRLTARPRLAFHFPSPGGPSHGGPVMSPSLRLFAAFFSLTFLLPLQAADRLTSRPRPVPPVERPLAVGTRVSTGPGEARRLVLPDRSVL